MGKNDTIEKVITTPDPEEAQELFNQLVTIVKQLGCRIAIPEETDFTQMPGLFIGSKPFLQKMTDIIANDHVHKKDKAHNLYS